MLKNAADKLLASRPCFRLGNRNKKISQVKMEHFSGLKRVKLFSVCTDESLNAVLKDVQRRWLEEAHPTMADGDVRGAPCILSRLL